ncbi:MAG: AAA family ATPase [Oscillospiraceae bacterium]|nr:AAA family ATPase [Oscillospiraceae bacterium]
MAFLFRQDSTKNVFSRGVYSDDDSVEKAKKQKGNVKLENNRKTLKTIDGKTLMAAELKPLDFVVDTLLATGLHILAGSPKVGKSWLALWLAVSVAKGESVWGMATKQGTTLYLCLEDSTLRIQNRLDEITDDVPANVHFCTEAPILGCGLEQQLESFLTEHPDTVLVIIDTLQMIRDARRDMTYANDYRDLTSLKRIADAHSVAILLIHHLRKEYAEDVFSRISGTTAISGAVDTSLTLVEQERGSGEATLYCIGRDIEYRELELARNSDNVWELTGDSRSLPRGGRLILLLSALMKDRTEFIGTPTELAELIDPAGMNQISPRKISGEVLKNLAALRENGIEASVRRSNGKRLIVLRRADSVDTSGGGNSVPIDPDALAAGAPL